MAQEYEYTVHFQRGTRIGARLLRMVTVSAISPSQAMELAKVSFPTSRSQGYRIIRVDHFDAHGHLIID